MSYGTVIASFTIEAFSLERLTRLANHEVEQRLKEFSRTVRVG